MQTSPQKQEQKKIKMFSNQLLVVRHCDDDTDNVAMTTTKHHNSCSYKSKQLIVMIILQLSGRSQLIRLISIMGVSILYYTMV